MKIKIKSAWRTALLIAGGAVLFSLAVSWIFDSLLNGFVLDWMESHWWSFKSFISCTLMVLAPLLAVGGWLAARLYVRAQLRGSLSLLAEAIRNGETDRLPAPYAEVESQLARLRAQAEYREQLLEQEASRKSDLITYLAHDLKTPLASVVGYLSLLDEAPDMPPAQRAKYIGVALEKAFRLEQLIHEFFEITRFNLHKIQLQPERINLSRMLEQLSDEFYPLLEPRGLQITIEMPPGFTLWGDADKLARVFNNILKNAIAYSDPGGQITVTVCRQDDNAVLTFANHGKPIPSHKLETIFEKFFRLDSARSSQTGGAGLGLAIAKEIIAAHGGSITAQSNAQETVFTVTLPAAAPQ